MTQAIPCPDPAQLEELSRGILAGEKQHEYTQHLDECEACQAALEKLTKQTVFPWDTADLSENDSAAPRQDMEQVAQSALESEEALLNVMERLKHGLDSSDDRSGDLCEAADVSLEYLEPTDTPGRIGRLGAYEVTGMVGRGGTGVVLKALDPSLNRFVAIKLLSPYLATSAAARRRFSREARAAAAVSHEHVVAIHGVDEIRGLPYLVMNYVPGESLQQRIARLGSLELGAILRIGVQTAAGLAAAHAQGLIHRDVKPANILLENGVDRVRITDFGLACAADDARITQSGVVAGTPEYMSPEQAAGGPVDQRSDLFSLGSVLYTMCTGRPPFRADTSLAILRSVCDEPPRSITELHPEFPDWLVAIIDKLLSKDPGDRFQSASEVADLMGQCLAHVQQPRVNPLPHAAKKLGREHARRRSTKRHSRPSWGTAAATLLLLLVGLGLTDALGITNVRHLVGRVVRQIVPIQLEPSGAARGDHAAGHASDNDRTGTLPGRPDGAATESISENNTAIPSSVLRLDPELVEMIKAKIVRAVPLAKDCAVIPYMPNWNHGYVDNLSIQTDGVRTLIDWPPLSAEDLNPLNQFVLALYSRYTRSDIPLCSILAYALRADWSEITSWNTQPAYGSEFSARYEFVPGNGWKLFDVTAQVRTRAIEPKAHGIMLRFAQEDLGSTDPSYSGYQFVSREGAGEWSIFRPVLIVVESRERSPE